MVATWLVLLPAVLLVPTNVSSPAAAVADGVVIGMTVANTDRHATTATIRKECRRPRPTLVTIAAISSAFIRSKPPSDPSPGDPGRQPDDN